MSEKNEQFIYHNYKKKPNKTDSEICINNVKYIDIENVLESGSNRSCRSLIEKETGNEANYVLLKQNENNQIKDDYKKVITEIKKIENKNHILAPIEITDNYEVYEKGECRLDKVFANKNDFSEKTTPLAIMLGGFLGLKNLIDNNIIHNDIKDNNMFLMKDNRVVIIDFDQSQIYNKNNETNINSVGNVFHLAPERCLVGSEKCTDFTKSDIYSMGITLFNLFSEQKNIDFIKEKFQNTVTNTNFDIIILQHKIKNTNNINETISESMVSEIGKCNNFLFFNDKNKKNDTINNSQKDEIKTKIIDIFDGILKVNYQERYDIKTVLEKINDLLIYLKETVKLDLTEDLKIPQRDLDELKKYLSEEKRINPSSSSDSISEPELSLLSDGKIKSNNIETKIKTKELNEKPNKLEKNNNEETIIMGRFKITKKKQKELEQNEERIENLGDNNKIISRKLNNIEGEINENIYSKKRYSGK